MTALYDRERGGVSLAGMALLLGVDEPTIRQQLDRGDGSTLDLPETWSAKGRAIAKRVKEQYGVTDVYDVLDVLAAEAAS